MNRIYPFFVILMLIGAVLACGGPSPTNPPPLPRSPTRTSVSPAIPDLSETEEALQEAMTAIAKTIDAAENPLTATPPSVSLQCSQTRSLVGQWVECVIPRAYCSYRPDIDGSPTFCNDGPYPSHNFTFLVWDQNCSRYDGECIIVEGYVSSYKGKPQVVGEGCYQATVCR